MTSSQRKYIAKLYNEMYDPLLSYALSVLPSPSQAEEAVQNTFQIACQKADEVCSSPNPKGWLTNTLKNVIGNELEAPTPLFLGVGASLHIPRFH